jgi:hypothetical protein
MGVSSHSQPGSLITVSSQTGLSLEMGLLAKEQFDSPAMRMQTTEGRMQHV